MNHPTTNETKSEATLEDLIGWETEDLKKAINEEDDIEVEDHIERHKFMGTVMRLTPSGKVYMPWSSNVSDEEAKKDEDWWDKLNEILSANKMFVFSGEGDPCDIFIGMVVEEKEAQNET